ncbi:hypothetical protein GOBAR_AA04591 [Gossypium barbadense]|uniref:Uncharacterized protein n=1 Tax=Gossypium barbadense TaxID=3634 RepID=A0A2P5YK72_GOSBA|nr:hypothetical protein GOBAR_AA04591 [Gossypium barbadense]
MTIHLPRIISSKKVPKGYFAVYVGENQKRFVIPVSFLNQPSFQDLLGMSQEEFGYSHPTGGLTIPCNEDIFLDVTSRLNYSGALEMNVFCPCNISQFIRLACLSVPALVHTKQLIQKVTAAS